MIAAPVQADIDLAAYADNLIALRQMTHHDAKLMAVVKADAYGHGAIPLARRAVETGVDFLGVARIGEALELREEGIEAPILIFGHTPVSMADTLIDYELTQTVYSLALAEAFAARAGERRIRMSVHLKVDTGMGRLGLPVEADEALDSALAIAALPGLAVDGIYTHFASADSNDKSFTEEQLEVFLGFLEALRQQGLEFPLRHIANSAAAIDMPESHLDMVRLGISTYGLLPSSEVATDRVELEPVMQLSARIMQIKEVPAGTPVSYGSTWTAPRPTTIATVAAGYADGLPRLASSGADMLVRGQRAPIAGRVCMDLTMVDVGDIPGVTLEDEVVVFGKQGSATLLVSELATHAETIPYEILTSVTERVPRVYRG